MSGAWSTTPPADFGKAAMGWRYYWVQQVGSRGYHEPARVIFQKGKPIAVEVFGNEKKTRGYFLPLRAIEKWGPRIEEN